MTGTSTVILFVLLCIEALGESIGLVVAEGELSFSTGEGIEIGEEDAMKTDPEGVILLELSSFTAAA
jgi:hypothetical protein